MYNRLAIPAGFLLVIAVITLVSVLVDFDELLKPQETRFKDPIIAKVDSMMQYVGWANLLTQPIVLAGAISMMQHKREGLCHIAAAVACIPCLGSCYAFPFGLWALAELNRPEAKSAFRHRRHGW